MRGSLFLITMLLMLTALLYARDKALALGPMAYVAPAPLMTPPLSRPAPTHFEPPRESEDQTTTLSALFEPVEA